MKKNGLSHFGDFYSPYQNGKRTSLDDFYEAYTQDSDKTISIGQKIYSKIIFRSRLPIKNKHQLSIVFCPSDTVHMHDTLIDEKENEFTVIGVEMLEFSKSIPKWYRKHVPLIIEGNVDNIGDYLTLKKE